MVCAARIGKNYVSYHLMAVYAFPDLLDGISPELKRRMQGKSYFNFTRVDENLFQELEELTQEGYERFKQEEMIINSNYWVRSLTHGLLQRHFDTTRNSSGLFLYIHHFACSSFTR